MRIPALLVIASISLTCEGCLSISGGTGSSGPAVSSITTSTTATTSPTDMIVFGQRSFFGVNANAADPTESTFNYPSQITQINGNWVVTDYVNNRVLIYGGGTPLTSPPTLVLGQGSLTTGLPNYPSLSASSLNQPWGVTSNGTNLVVSDSTNSRVLVWNSFPTTSGQPADVVIGQANFSSNLSNQGLSAPAANTLGQYLGGVTYVGNKLVIADYGNNRVLIFNSTPTSNNASADVVIGQANMTTATANTGGASASTLNSPFAVETDGTRLAVADTYNHRILVWNTVPSSNGTAADVVVGEPDFATVGGGTSSSLVSYPADVAFSSGALYVADSNNNRILLWSSLPASGAAGAASGTAAIGQADFTSASANRGSSTGVANGVNWPYGISVIGGSLYVADSGNSRILQFTPLPTGASDTAVAEYGQTDFTGMYPNGVGPNQLGLSYPQGIAVTSQYLIVGDRSNTRYLVYDKNATSSGAQALAVIGQPNFTSTQSNQGGAAAANTIHGGTGADVLSCATDSSGRLYISDRVNNRVLVFNQVPTTNNASADYVLGQSSFSATAASAGATGLNAPYGVTVQGNTLYVADSGNYRVLAYTLPITANQQAASLVIGQPDFNTTSSGSGANKFLGLPSLVYTDGSSLYVGDYSNRVMVFSPVPTSSNPTATAVIGQPDFATSGVTGATNAQQFNGPNYVSNGAVMEVSGMAEFGGYLLIPDPNQNRILGFDLSSISTYMSATAVIGQASFSINNGSVYSTADGSAFVNLANPKQILTDPYSSYVWISDSWTSRVIRVQQSAISKYIH